MGIEDDDKLAGANAKERRISLDDIKAEIDLVIYTNGDQLLRERGATLQQIAKLHVVTLCTIVTHSGFVVFGKSAPMSVANFDRELGEKFAYEDAIRQLWPLMAFHVKQLGA